MDHGKEYEEGLRDGRLEYLEKTVADLTNGHRSHEQRLRYLERIAASMLAIVAFTTVLPGLVKFFENMAH